MTEINSTYDYHKSGKPDLINEYTICESFASEKSPCSLAFDVKKPYGALLGDFLIRLGVLNPDSIIAEAGGGYGSLMIGMLQEHDHLIDRIIMFDLSFYLLKIQRNSLRKWQAKTDFIQADIHELFASISGINLLILNEVIGDMNVACNNDPGNMKKEVNDLVRKYNLEIPEYEFFNFNIGAVRLVEEISRHNYSVFLSEHSSDPVFPEGMEYLDRGLEQGFPREIKLHKHSEFTIRFSHLVKVAQSFGREVITGPLIDVPGFRNIDSMRFIFLNRICGTDKQEIIFELLDHIREYRWMLIK
ncbi:MAG: class I SAM-dependent methyltransferase [Spirochaetes bacterium]|nr:class I SAM-dependent methyltransferase [Spirochaetota bacterium]